MNTPDAHDALLFRSLHDPRQPLALSNAWDVASALISEAAGVSAVATTSAGVAWSLGLPDGNHLAREQAIATVRAIVAAVKVPVTADVEGGYANSAGDVARTIDGMLGAGAVGVNIEDGSLSPEELAARVAAARSAANTAGVELFINARTDVFLAGIGAPEARLAETLDRAQRYLDAGADGIFVPGVVDTTTIGALASGIDAPLNVMAGVGAPSVAELGRLGVARVSLGSGVAQAAYAVARRAATELVSTGTYGATSEAVDYGELNALMGSPTRG